MASSVADADMSATEYDLRIHDGEVTGVFRLRDSGISLVGKEIEWRIDGVTRRAALSDIQAIRLTTAEETARGPLGTTTCQIRFRGGGAVTVFGGNSESPDAADRRACYETFVAEATKIGDLYKDFFKTAYDPTTVGMPKLPAGSIFYGPMAKLK